MQKQNCYGLYLNVNPAIEVTALYVQNLRLSLIANAHAGPVRSIKTVVEDKMKFEIGDKLTFIGTHIQDVQCTRIT